MYFKVTFFTLPRSLINLSEILSLHITLILFLWSSIVLNTPCVVAQTASNNPSLVERFWEIGCEFSGVVTRVRRSAPSAASEEPNFDDPEELFKYLYPLADVKPGEDPNGNLGSQRSKHGTHSLSSWLEDLLELWHSECRLRRNKRSSRRMSEFNREESTEPRRRFHGMFGKRNKEKSENGFGRRNSSLGIFARRGDGTNDDGDANGGYKYILPQENGGNNGTDLESEIYEAYRNDKGEEILQELEDKKPDKDKDKDKGQSGSGGSGSGGAPVDKPVEAPEKEDIFFAQYGGDIEYFFPLLSFGIPFDGEITLLGFHGFRGIFPY